MRHVHCLWLPGPRFPGEVGLKPHCSARPAYFCASKSLNRASTSGSLVHGSRRTMPAAVIGLRVPGLSQLLRPNPIQHGIPGPGTRGASEARGDFVAPGDSLRSGILGASRLFGPLRDLADAGRRGIVRARPADPERFGPSGPKSGARRAACALFGSALLRNAGGAGFCRAAQHARERYRLGDFYPPRRPRRPRVDWPVGRRRAPRSTQPPFLHFPPAALISLFRRRPGL